MFNQLEIIEVKKILDSDFDNITKLSMIRNYIYSNFNLFVKYYHELGKIKNYLEDIRRDEQEIEILKQKPTNFNVQDYENVFKIYSNIKHFKNYDKLMEHVKTYSYYNNVKELNSTSLENIYNSIFKTDVEIDDLTKHIKMNKGILTIPEFVFYRFLDEELDIYINKFNEDEKNKDNEEYQKHYTYEDIKKINDIINIINSMISK